MWRVWFSGIFGFQEKAEKIPYICMNSTTSPQPSMERQNEVLENVIIKFAGDSGDGMQLTGTQFTNTAALFGNDLSTFPDFPAEIRAPQGTLAGVSGFSYTSAVSRSSRRVIIATYWLR